MSSAPSRDFHSLGASVIELLQQRGDDEAAIDEARRRLAPLHASEVADLLESLPPEERLPVWRLLDTAITGEVLLESSEEVRGQLIRESTPERLAAAMTLVDVDKLADLYDELPAPVIDAVIGAMQAQRRRALETLRRFPEDSAGGLMDQDAIAVRSDVTLEVVQRYLRWIRRQRGDLPASTDTLMVVDALGRYEGVLALADVVSLDPHRRVSTAMRLDVPGIPAMMPANKVARLFQDRDLVSAPVVDEADQLLGRITVDDMVDVLQDEAEHALLARAGLDEEHDMFAPVLTSARRRTMWLGVNLFNAFIAAWVIGRFGAAIEQMVALAVLMPVVASMGGVAGNQTLTLVTRGIALDQVGHANTRRLLAKEIGVALVGGLFWAIVVGTVALAWFGSAALGAVFGTAILLNMVSGTAAGTLVPLGLSRLGIDPALAGGVLLTALTDVVGFASFLALAMAFVV
jgi:magnesium transporter